MLLEMSGRNVSFCFLFYLLSDEFEDVWYLIFATLIIDFVYNDEVGGFDILRDFPVAL